MSWNHIRDTRPKAQKNYRCDLCAGTILKGEQYIRREGSDDCDKEIVTWKMHIECEEVTKSWGYEEWECHDTCEFIRPKKEASND